MESTHVEKGKELLVAELVEYTPNTEVTKTIMERTTGRISAISCDFSEGLTEKIIPFDRFVLIIDGQAEIDIDGVSHILDTGNYIIIPAHTANSIKPMKRFKMISTIIKSGYE